MPWGGTTVVERRRLFVAGCGQAEDSVAALCREFDISRTTGYKWLGRYRSDGAAGLLDRSRRPRHSVRATPSEVETTHLHYRAQRPAATFVINGTAPEFAAWPSMECRYAQSEFGSGVWRADHGGHGVELDFRRWSRKE